jgi:hypothetical protein
MGFKLKIYLGMAVLIIAIFTYQYIVIKNLKNQLHDSTINIVQLKQNSLAVRDSLNFKDQKIGVLHTFIKDQESLNKDLEKLYSDIKDKSGKDIKKLKNTVGLLTGEINFKNRVIDSLTIHSPDVTFSDTTITIPIMYNNSEMGLSLDGKAVGNFINKTGYVHWNRIETKLPKLKIGLVYDANDSTIVAMVEANNQIETFKTVMSDQLFKLIIDNSLPQETWKDRMGLLTEIEYINNPMVNVHIFCYYKSFYLTVGKRFDIFDSFSGLNVYRVGFKQSLSDILKRF